MLQYTVTRSRQHTKKTKTGKFSHFQIIPEAVCSGPKENHSLHKPMLLCLLVCLLWVFTDFVSATYIESTDKRLAVELEANVLIHPSSDEPRFSDSITNCFIDRVINTGFTVVLPGDECLHDLKSAHNFFAIYFFAGFARGQKGKDGLVVNATFVDQMTVICHVPQLITTGNTSIVPGNGSDGRFSAAFFESFAILSPAYGRRPYVRESNGSIVLQLDQSFLNSPVTPLALCVTVPQNESLGCILSLRSLPMYTCSHFHCFDLPGHP